MIHDLNAAKKCAEYILESELDDFIVNPSDNHVYYHAMVSLFGKKSADNELENWVNNIFEQLELNEGGN